MNLKKIALHNQINRIIYIIHQPIAYSRSLFNAYQCKIATKDISEKNMTSNYCLGYMASIVPCPWAQDTK